MPRFFSRILPKSAVVEAVVQTVAESKGRFNLQPMIQSNVSALHGVGVAQPKVSPGAGALHFARARSLLISGQPHPFIDDRFDIRCQDIDRQNEEIVVIGTVALKYAFIGGNFL